MESSCVQFIEKFTQSFEFLKITVQETLEYWEPDQPPVTALFSDIGSAISRQFDSLDNEEKILAFKYIEDGMKSNNIMLKTAVGTGLIETIVCIYAKDKFLWQQIEVLLGEESKHHADCWRDFQTSRLQKS